MISIILGSLTIGFYQNSYVNPNDQDFLYSGMIGGLLAGLFFDFLGFPIVLLEGKAEFKTLLNCSAQFVLLGSFHIIVWFAKLAPLLSTIDSVVETVSNFNKPFAALFLLGLYDSNLASLKTDSLLSASSKKFSLEFKSTR